MFLLPSLIPPYQFFSLPSGLFFPLSYTFCPPFSFPSEQVWHIVISCTLWSVCFASLQLVCDNYGLVLKFEIFTHEINLHQPHSITNTDWFVKVYLQNISPKFIYFIVPPSCSFSLVICFSLIYSVLLRILMRVESGGCQAVLTSYSNCSFLSCDISQRGLIALEVNINITLFLI